MGIIDIFSKRRKRETGKTPDVYQYEDIPDALRVQVIHILNSTIGTPDRYNQASDSFYTFVRKTLCREYGVFLLHSRSAATHQEDVCNFFLQTRETEKALDFIELCFKVIVTHVKDNLHEFHQSRQTPSDAVDELNSRFREHGVGYQFESGAIIRIDSQVLHSQAVKPALLFLSEAQFKGANEEFISAHSHYRDGKHKECLNDCLKAFESTMKSICNERRWAYQQTDTAKKLLDVLFERELIPTFMQSHFTGLRTTLEAGIPTVRNKLGGHGQGSTLIKVPESFAAYALHLTATNILFLAQCDKELK